MAGPLIPYITLPELPLDFLLQVPWLGERLDPAHPPSIKPFGTLVATGVYLGSVLAIRHAKQRGLDEVEMRDFIVWVVTAGFVGAHVFDAIFYQPQALVANPLFIFALWAGLSSYGGFGGAIIGLLLWRWVRRRSALPYADMVCSAFPLAWVFGRAGCATVHDHPGRLSEAWYAVRWPAGDGFVGRLDLGLIEMVLTIPLAVAFWLLWRRGPRPFGFFAGTMCIAYAPVRFGLDFLRAPEGGLIAADPRYAGLTPAQWASIGLVGLGVYLLKLQRPLAAPPPAAFTPTAPPATADGESSRDVS